MPSRLSPQWPYGNSCIWSHDVRLHIAGTNQRVLNKLSGHKWSTTHIYITHIYYIYIKPISLLRDLSTLCVVDHLRPPILRSLLSLLSILWFIGTSNVQSYIFSSLVPAMCNRTSCPQVHELPWGHWRIGNNREGTLSVFLTTYILRCLSYFCEIWALCMSWVTSNQFYYIILLFYYIQNTSA